MKKLIAIMIFILLTISLVNAITGSMGNAKMILKVNPEDIPVTLEKYILVKNVNNETINIRLEPTEEIKDIVRIYDGDFNLTSKQEKKVRFDIKVKEKGIYNGNINVFFTSLEKKGAGVVLTSNVIVNAGENSNDQNIEVENEDENNTNVSISFGGTGNVVKDVKNEETNPLLILAGVFGTIIGVTIIIFLILIKKAV